MGKAIKTVFICGVICLALIITGLIGLFVVMDSGRRSENFSREEVTDALKDKYNEDFEIIKDVHYSSDRGGRYGYVCVPQKNKNIKFLFVDFNDGFSGWQSGDDYEVRTFAYYAYKNGFKNRMDSLDELSNYPHLSYDKENLRDASQRLANLINDFNKNIKDSDCDISFYLVSNCNENDKLYLSFFGKEHSNNDKKSDAIYKKSDEDMIYKVLESKLKEENEK